MNTETLLKSRPYILIIDLLIFFGIIASISLFADHADIVLLLAWVIITLYLLLTKRFLSFSHLILATTIALLWVFIAQDNYGYNHEYFSVAGMNVLPLAGWSLSWLGVSEVFNHFKTKRKLLNFILFIPVFWLLMVLVETYAFHVIEIRDTMSGNAIGLPFCNCIHTPWWMRIAYFTMGPLYYGLTIITDSFAIKYIKPTQ